MTCNNGVSRSNRTRTVTWRIQFSNLVEAGNANVTSKEAKRNELCGRLRKIIGVTEQRRKDIRTENEEISQVAHITRIAPDVRARIGGVADH